jgi:hypothetical protein
MKAIYLLIALCLVLSACGPSAQQLTSTAVAAFTNTPTATQTPLPTETATPTPTRTPRPTKTNIPPTPTPASIGSSVIYDSLEITVLDVATHSQIVPGGLYYYYSKPGFTFIDLGVLVKNLNPGQPVKVAWSYIYVTEAGGKSWYPLYGDFKQVDSGKTYDPFNIGVKTEINGSSTMTFDNDTYLRLIYYVTDDPNQTILFNIEDSPLIGFKLPK